MQTVCVVGLGYIGLPTAALLANSGLHVIGVDICEETVSQVNQGRAHFEESGLDSLLQQVVSRGQLEGQAHPSAADAFILCLPTPLRANRHADLGAVVTATRSIVPVLGPGNLVVLESTVPPKTTEEIIIPILEESGLKVSRDGSSEEVHVAHCPERVIPGSTLSEMVNNDRIVGGVTREAGERARVLYSRFVKGAIHVTDVTTAEFTKLAENTFRDVNIALANELSIYCEELGISIWEVLELANKHPRVSLHRPGPGVGGHCLPIDPWFVIERSPEKSSVIPAARLVNDAQPTRVARLVMHMVRGIQHAKIALLGLAYKANIDDVRESPTLEILTQLSQAGYETAVHDPRVNRERYDICPLEDALRGADCAVLLVDHREYDSLDPVSMSSLMRRANIVDTRGVVDISLWTRAGFRVEVLGRGERRD
jgi:UDP-N-acetyl-D-mannosaminuronic acid dehydrogenase